MSNLNELAKEGEKILAEVEEKAHLKKKKKPFYKKGWIWLLVVFFAVLIVLAVGYFRYWLPFKTILQGSNQAQFYFQQAQQRLIAADFRTASVYLENARTSLERIENSINSLGVVVQLGPLEKQYRALKAITLAGKKLSQGLQQATYLSAQILDPLQISQDKKFADIAPTERRKILESVYQAAPEIQGAKAEIELAQTQLDNMDTSDLHPLLEKYVKELRIKLAEVQTVLAKAAVLSRTLPVLLGYPGERNYLFLLQNNDELRPTGGFIGTIGVLRIKDGEIRSFDTDNVYKLDKNAEGKLKIKLPKPIDRFMHVDYWYLRDSNWSPDFPTAAKKAEEFFRLESRLSGSPFKPEKFDGVIAITQDVVEDFLRLTGAIEVKGFVFNADNFTDRLEYLVEIGYRDVDEDYGGRKNIIGILSQRLVERIERMPLEKWIDVIKILENNLNEKQFLVYVNDPVLQQEIEKQNWADRVKSTPLDYIMWIDANLAALKTDQYVKRKLVYQVYPNKKGNLVAKAAMAYENTGTFTWKSTRYRTYARLYVPQGSKLIKTSGSMLSDKSSLPYPTDVYDELGKTVFGAFISVEPGEKGTLSFEYELPKHVKDVVMDGYYSLLAQKQAGTNDVEFYLDLNFWDKITSAFPAEERSGWGDKKYRLTTDLNIDRVVKVNF